jgi:hypothetical protein
LATRKIPETEEKRTAQGFRPKARDNTDKDSRDRRRQGYVGQERTQKSQKNRNSRKKAQKRKKGAKRWNKYLYTISGAEMRLSRSSGMQRPSGCRKKMF